MRLTVLGSGTPAPRPARASSGYLVEVGDDVLLLDHGFGAGDRLLQAGFKPTDVSHVFLTHHHYDHMGDLARLLLTRWDQQRGPHAEIRLFGPPPLGTIVDRLIGPDGAFAVDLSARIESACSRELYAFRGGVGTRTWPVPDVRELMPGDVVDGAGWTITTAKAIHCPGDLTCLAFRVEADGRSIVYSGDTGPHPAVDALAQGCDLLVHMCSRDSGDGLPLAVSESSIGHREVAELAAGAGAGMLVLSHIGHMDDPAVRDRTLQDIGAIYHGEVVVAADLMRFEVAGRGARLENETAEVAL